MSRTCLKFVQYQTETGEICNNQKRFCFSCVCRGVKGGGFEEEMVVDEEVGGERGGGRVEQVHEKSV